MSISDDINTSAMLKRTLADATLSKSVDVDNMYRSDVVYATFSRYHSNFSFILSSPTDLLASIDSARVSDIIVFVTKYSPDDMSNMITEVCYNYNAYDLITYLTYVT